MKQTIEVTAAIIKSGEKILAARRASHKDQPGFWEFPGGKIEPTETAEDCLVRELQEELGICAKIERYFASSTHEYPNNIINLHAYLVGCFEGEIQLRDHDKILWVPTDQIGKLKWAPADIPFVNKLMIAFS